MLTNQILLSSKLFKIIEKKNIYDSISIGRIMYSLKPFAMKQKYSRGRFQKEKYDDSRSIFERDRDRIIHCRHLENWNIKLRFL